MSSPLLSHLAERVLEAFSDAELIERLFITKTTEEELDDLAIKFKEHLSEKREVNSRKGLRPISYELLYQMLQENNKCVFKLDLGHGDPPITNLRFLKEVYAGFILTNGKYDIKCCDGFRNDSGSGISYGFMNSRQNGKGLFTPMIGDMYVTSVNGKEVGEPK
jgi:hypothetical protein